MQNQNGSGIFSFFGAIVAALLLFLGLNSIVIINPGQAGVLSILGKAQDGPLLEGLHFKPPSSPLWTSMTLLCKNLKSPPKVPLETYRN